MFMTCWQVIAGTEAPAVELRTATAAAPASPSQEVAGLIASPNAAGGSPAAKRKVHIVLPEPSPRPPAAGGRGGGLPGSHAAAPGKAPPR